MKTIVRDAEVVGSNPVASTKRLSDRIVMRSDFLYPRKIPEKTLILYFQPIENIECLLFGSLV